MIPQDLTSFPSPAVVSAVALRPREVWASPSLCCESPSTRLSCYRARLANWRIYPENI